MNIDLLSAKKGIRFISISNDIGLDVILCSYGASIYSIKMDLESMILSPKDFNLFYHDGKYYGKTVGRIAGRVPDGKLEVNGKTYQLEQNENTNCLHGGTHSISFRNWGYQVETYKEYIEVTFYLTTRKGEAGFNGKAKYNVRYRIPAKRNCLEIYYDAVCKEDTYFAMTNHAYFNLGMAKTILDHKLCIKANEVSTMDPNNFCINGYKPVNNTPFDFKNPKLIRKDIADEELHNIKWLNGYDHRFHFMELPISEAKVSLAGELYRMNIYTDFDAVQVYTDGFSNNDELLDDEYDAIHRGVALECSNQYPEFVKKGEHYKHFIRYNFWRKTDE